MGLADKLAAQNAGVHGSSVTQQQQRANPVSPPQQATYSPSLQSYGGFLSPATSQQASYQSPQQPQGSPGFSQQRPGGYPTQQQPQVGTFSSPATPQQAGYQSPQQPQGSPGFSQQRPGGYPTQQQPQAGNPSQQQNTNVLQQQQSNQPADPEQISAYKQILQLTIQEKQLQSFFPAFDTRLDQAATVAAANIYQVCTSWRLPKEMGQDLAKLALFDIVLYIDNSGSMFFEEDGKRIEELRIVLNYVVGIVKLFDSDGLTIKFMNDARMSLDNVKDEETINRVLAQPGLFHGTTPLGEQLRQQVINDIVAKARAGSMPKPVLVIAITDGTPLGESDTALHDAILYATSEVARTKYGPGAVSFEFAQVGNDKKAQDFLEQLDNDPHIGHIIDCTSNYEQESEQMRRINGSDLTPQLWILKLLLGAIDSSYDTKDEKQSHQGMQGTWGAPPPYGAQSGFGQQHTGYYY